MKDDGLRGLLTFVPDCRAVLEEGVVLVVSRFGRNPGYPFVDTKLSTITGADFPEPSDPGADFRGHSAIFGWIQGRGLEALAGHAAFFKDQPELAAQCDRMLVAAADCARALFGPFRSPVSGLFLQTRDARGEPSLAVPATPDADPGYHTGLCLIDFITNIQ